jgi:hypothetical protein
MSVRVKKLPETESSEAKVESTATGPECILCGSNDCIFDFDEDNDLFYHNGELVSEEKMDEFTDNPHPPRAVISTTPLRNIQVRVTEYADEICASNDRQAEIDDLCGLFTHLVREDFQPVGTLNFLLEIANKSQAHGIVLAILAATAAHLRDADLSADELYDEYMGLFKRYLVAKHSRPVGSDVLH